MAVASISHPKYRDQYLKAIKDDVLFTKSPTLSAGKVPHGVTMYQGDIKLDD